MFSRTACPWVLHGAFFWILIWPQSSVPQTPPATNPSCTRGALPIRATCSAFFTSCSARVLKRLDVYLYILNRGRSDLRACAAGGRVERNHPAFSPPKLHCLAPCDESKTSLFWQKDSILFY